MFATKHFHDLCRDPPTVGRLTSFSVSHNSIFLISTKVSAVCVLSTNLHQLRRSLSVWTRPVTELKPGLTQVDTTQQCVNLRQVYCYKLALLIKTSRSSGFEFTVEKQWWICRKFVRKWNHAAASQNLEVSPSHWPLFWFLWKPALQWQMLLTFVWLQTASSPHGLLFFPQTSPLDTRKTNKRAGVLLHPGDLLSFSFDVQKTPKKTGRSPCLP